MSVPQPDLRSEAAAFTAAVRAFPDPARGGVVLDTRPDEKMAVPEGTAKFREETSAAGDESPCCVAQTGLPRLPRQGNSGNAAFARSGRPARGQVLPPSDLGGAPEHIPPDPVFLAELAKELGPIATRHSPIRNAILCYLKEPRSAAEVALHIRRPVPIATGHLAAMRRRGLVKRIGHATYALATYAGEPVNLGNRRNRSGARLRARLRKLLVYRRSLGELCTETDETLGVVLAALQEMWLSGLVTGDRCDGYQLVAVIRAGQERGGVKLHPVRNTPS